MLSKWKADVVPGLATDGVVEGGDPAEEIGMTFRADRPGTMIPAAILGSPCAGEGAEARFLSMLRLSGIWYWELDADYRFIRSHFDVRENEGLRADGYLGRCPWEVGRSALPAPDVERWKAALFARQPFRDVVLLRLSADGEHRWVRSHGEPIFDERGTFHGYHGLSQDITELRQTEQQQAIQHGVTASLAASTSLPAAITAILGVICTTMGWEYAAWYPGDEVPAGDRRAQQWCLPRSEGTGIVEAAMASDTPFLREAVGAEASDRSPCWLSDLSSLGPVRRLQAVAAGLNAAFTFPIRAGDRLFGVVECFARCMVPPDRAITPTVMAIGSQVGEFIVRREMESRYRELVELSPDGIVSLSDGRIDFVNAAAIALMGARDEGDLLGHPLPDFVAPVDDARLQDVLAGARLGPMALHSSEFRMRRLDGTEVLTEVRTGPAESGRDRSLQVVLRDVSDRVRSERKIQRLTRLYAALSETHEAIARLSSPQALFEAVCTIGTTHGQFAMTGIAVVDDANRRLEPAAVSGNAALFLGAQARLDDAGRFDVSPAVIAVLDDAPQIVQDIGSDHRMAPWRDALTASGVRASLHAPLRRLGAPVGVLVLHAVEANYFDGDLVELVLRMAANISYALDAMEAARQRAVAERALEEKQRALTTFIGNLPGLAYRCRNDASWTMEFVSDGCHELTGYRAADLVGNRVIAYGSLVHRDDLDRVRAELHAADGGRFVLRYRIVTAQGDTRWVWEQGQGLRDDQGEVVAFEGIIEDVTPQVTLERVLVERKHQLRVALEASGQGLWDWNVESDRLYHDHVAAQIIGCQAVEADAGVERWRRCVHPDDLERFLQLADGCVSGGTDLLQVDCRTVRDGGEVIWVSICGRVTDRSATGRAMRIIGTLKDVSERKRDEARMVFLAQYDVLTGLPNRGLFRDRLSLALSRAKRSRALVGLLVLDLDRFKYVNDSLGHDVGDMVLQEIASRLRMHLGSVDTIARLGGDEFAVIVEDEEEVGELAALADKVRWILAAPMSVAGRELFFNVSIGVALYPYDTADVETLMKNADLAMYRAKQQGGNVHLFYAPEMHAKSIERLSIESELRRALERDELVLHFQPRAEVGTGRITGVEALVRWNSARGLVMPGGFIPIAEENGLILEIGYWVLRSACAQCVAWQAAGLPPTRVAVNLSPRQFMQQDLLTRILGVLEETGLAPEYLELEITETTLMHQGDSVLDTLAAVSATGIRLAIDDFGTGYSSLAYLKRFPVQDIKIDRSFVSNVTEDPDDAAIVTAIVHMARSLGLQLIAEGVETQGQLDFLRTLGCDAYQGFLLSRPVPADQIATLLRAHVP